MAAPGLACPSRKLPKSRANVLLLLSGSSSISTSVPQNLTTQRHVVVRVIRNSVLSGIVDNVVQTTSLNPVKGYGSQTPIQSLDTTPSSNDCYAHAQWADVLYVEASAGLIGEMLAGLTTNLMSSILRCWDVQKPVILLPLMSTSEWNHPLTKKQMEEIGRSWNWIQVLDRGLGDINTLAVVDGIRQSPGVAKKAEELEIHWAGPDKAVQAINAEVKKITSLDLPKDMDDAILQNLSPTTSIDKPATSTSISRSKPAPAATQRAKHFLWLPPEIWTIVSDMLGDWEYSTALGFYTQLPSPPEWQAYLPHPNTPPTIEWLLLTSRFPLIRRHLDSISSTHPSALSALSVKLIFKFSLTNVLTHLATHQKDIFWTSFASFSLSPIPHKASIIYNKPSILQWWRDSPAILQRDYGPEALNGASRAGFVDVLDWWAASGLEMRYTEKALEAASAFGHLRVLEWWRRAHHLRLDTHSTSASGAAANLLPLHVGRSILSAAQAGRTEVVAWWDGSGLAYPHGESVARVASTHGHVEVLELWRRLKGNKMIFDNQVLVGATKGGHVGVLEWWKQKVQGELGIKVEYKTCDIEEALEDSLGGSGEEAVREWWERNGLNLGVGPNEWSRVKTLGD